MSTINKCVHEDWCHICGKRREEIANVWYPVNAEHTPDPTQLIRICAVCADLVARVARGDLPPTTETESPHHNKHESAFLKEETLHA